MGRWLKKIDKCPATEVSKPTKPSNVSFDSADSMHIRKKSTHNDILHGMVTKASEGLNLSTQYIIDSCYARNIAVV